MKKNFKSLHKKEIILDTNILSDLDDINALYLPDILFSKVYISKNVQIEELDTELNDKVTELGYECAHLDSNDGYSKFLLLNSIYPKLSISDKIVVCIAYEKNIICCTNDRRARTACDDLGVQVAGTLGILACAYENNIINFADFSKLFNHYIYISARLDSTLIDSFRTLYNIPVNLSEIAIDKNKDN